MVLEFGSQTIKQFEDGTSCCYSIEPKHRRDFCMLALKLIQCRDLELDEIFTLLKSGKYALLPIHIKRFETNLKNLYNNGIGTLQDLMQGIATFLVDPGIVQPSPVVNKSSVIGKLHS